MRTLLVVLLLIAPNVYADAGGEPPRDGRRWHLGIEGMTDFPITVGVQVWAELPYRFRLTMSAGEMPDAYLQAINSIAIAAGAYNQRQGNFITELLDHAATWRTQVGWRPFRRLGLYVEASFGVMTVEKGVALADIIEQATSFPVPQEANVGLGYDVHTVVETLGVEVGWMWYLWRDLTIRANVAFVEAVGAQVSIKPNFASTLQRPFTSFAEDYGEDLILKHLIIPTVGLALGWRLF